MSDNSKISWTDRTWNPLLGCERVSDGCDHCYAIIQARIRAGNPHPKIAAAFKGLVTRTEDGLDWSGSVNMPTDRLREPFRWRKPQRVFINSLSDVFYSGVNEEAIARLFAVMAGTPHITYQVLTKRHARMRSLLSREDFWSDVFLIAENEFAGSDRVWPLPNVHLGVSAEDQHWADIRIPALLDTPAAVRFVSAEPLLGSIDLGLVEEWDKCTCGVGPHGYYGMHERGCGTSPGPSWDRLHWVIVGGESGPSARPMDLAWAHSLIRQCRDADVPVFMKQVGSVAAADLGPFAGRKGGNWEALPDSLRVREFPRIAQGAAA